MYDTYSKPSLTKNTDIFRHIILFWHIQPYCGMFRILCDSCIFRTLPHSKACHIRTQDILRILPRNILAHSECCVYNAHILRTLVNILAKSAKCLMFNSFSSKSPPTQYLIVNKNTRENYDNDDDYKFFWNKKTGKK